MLCRCIWHLGQNIISNLSGILAERLKPFLDSFYKMNKCVEKVTFLRLWARLMTEFPDAAPYMEKHLGGESNMCKWALPWQVCELAWHVCNAAVDTNLT